MLCKGTGNCSDLYKLKVDLAKVQDYLLGR